MGQPGWGHRSFFVGIAYAPSNERGGTIRERRKVARCHTLAAIVDSSIVVIPRL